VKVGQLLQIFQRKKAKEFEAYALGHRTAATIIQEIEREADAILTDRRLNFIAVLDGWLSGIKSIEGATYTQQAQIELKVMLDNWSERMTGQEQDIWSSVSSRWHDVLAMLDADIQQLQDIIHDRVGWHYSQLIDEGLEHAVDAVRVYNKSERGFNV
jgi:hypothetical protein